MLYAKRFRGGTHPPTNKRLTEKCPVENLTHPQKVIIPLQQHIGTPAVPIVQKGDYVKTGQMIGKSEAFVSAPVHASISGTIHAIEPRPHPLGKNLLSIIIDSDGKDHWTDTIAPQSNYMDLSAAEMIHRVQEAGIVGMGGAAFPAHVKLSPPPEKPIENVIINGSECEPYITTDHRLMLEKSDQILSGVKILMKIFNAKRAFIGIEKNKRDAIRLIKKKTLSKKNISVVPLIVKYPQGEEKQLIHAVMGREVPYKGFPMDIGCSVHNVGTTFAMFEAVSSQKPLIERITTVTGPGIANPKNLRVRVGTPFQYLIEYCGGYTGAVIKLIHGGPMVGVSQVTSEVPLIKGTLGILVLDKKTANLKPQSPCIHCARCVDVCPMKLLPNQIADFVEHNRIEDAYRLGILNCMKCGCCSYICPSKRNLLQYIDLGKSLWHEKQEKVSQQSTSIF